MRYLLAFLVLTLVACEPKPEPAERPELRAAPSVPCDDPRSQRPCPVDSLPGDTIGYTP